MSSTPEPSDAVCDTAASVLVTKSENSNALGLHRDGGRYTAEQMTLYARVLADELLGLERGPLVDSPLLVGWGATNHLASRRSLFPR